METVDQALVLTKNHPLHWRVENLILFHINSVILKSTKIHPSLFVIFYRGDIVDVISTPFE